MFLMYVPKLLLNALMPWDDTQFCSWQFVPLVTHPKLYLAISRRTLFLNNSMECPFTFLSQKISFFLTLFNKFMLTEFMTNFRYRSSTSINAFKGQFWTIIHEFRTERIFGDKSLIRWKYVTIVNYIISYEMVIDRIPARYAQGPL